MLYVNVAVRVEYPWHGDTQRWMVKGFALHLDLNNRIKSSVLKLLQHLALPCLCLSAENFQRMVACLASRQRR